MLAPLAITAATLVLMRRTYKHDPRDVTPMMTRAFAVKMVVIGAYVAMVLGVLNVRTAPFIVSFTAYFIGLHFIEFLYLRHIMAVEGQTTKI